MVKNNKYEINIGIGKSALIKLPEKYPFVAVIVITTLFSLLAFIVFYNNGLGVAYNDARSHLDIGRRVVESLKPGLAQLGSVWLPLPHFLMIPTVWNDFFWQSGLSGAMQSMISYVATTALVYLFLKRIGVGLAGRFFGSTVFALNLNVLYLQSTAMTELLLLATMTAGVYFLLVWHQTWKLLDLMKASFFIMLSTLVRYDGWFLLAFAFVLVFLQTIRHLGYKAAEAKTIFFATLGGFGIVLWFVWNLLIFGDPLYFAFGPFSAHAQQSLLESAGDLQTKGNLVLSATTYFYAVFYNSYAAIALFGFAGALVFWFDKRISSSIRLATTALFAPLLFNIIALFMGHSVLFIPDLFGNTWFNVRYGIMLAPSFAIFAGYLFDRYKNIRVTSAVLSALVVIFAFLSFDAVTIDDARFGSSQKNVEEVSGWLKENASDTNDLILVSAASHDAILFSAGMPMKRYIHEGTGRYWEYAIENPDSWARWIIMRTYDENDLVWRELKDSPKLNNYTLVESHHFADIYELDDEYTSNLQHVLSEI